MRSHGHSGETSCHNNLCGFDFFFVRQCESNLGAPFEATLCWYKGGTECSSVFVDGFETKYDRLLSELIFGNSRSVHLFVILRRMNEC